MRPTKESINCSFIFSFLASSASSSSFMVASIVGDSSLDGGEEMVALVSSSKYFIY